MRACDVSNSIARFKLFLFVFYYNININRYLV